MVLVGHMAFPAMITCLNEVYGAHGAILVMPTVHLHLVVTAVMVPRYIVEPDDCPTFSLQKRRDKTTLKRHVFGRESEKQRLYRIDEREDVEIAAALIYLSNVCSIKLT